MKSPLPVPPAAGQQTGTVPAAAPATCRYPGCGNPARTRAGDGPGAPPRYCGLAVAEDRGEHGTAEVTHTALTAFRRRQELSGADAGADAGRPVTVAVARAAAIRDDVLAAITGLSARLEGVLGQLGGIGAQLAAAASPDAAEAQIEAVRAETTADLEAARAELARQVTLTHAAREAGTEARAAAAQAITAMETAQAALADAGTRAEAAAAAQAETARQAHAQAAQARAAADAAITAATQDARAQVSQLQAETKAAITAARDERDTALAQAAAATAHAQDARDQLTQLRDDHDRHAAELTTAHQAQLATLGDTITELRQRLHRAEADTAAERAERQRLTTHLQELTTPGDNLKAATPGHPRAGRYPRAAAGPAVPRHLTPKEHTMSELVTARISAHAARLGLHQLAASAPALIQRAHDAQLGYADFLDLIPGEETAAKDDRRFASALHVSGLPHHKTLDDFDFTFQPGLDIRKIKDLATLDFVTQAANVALPGPPGTGKTHLAVALAVAACAAGRSVYFTSLDDMIRKLRTADQAGDLGRQLRGYLRSSILVIDEVGYLPLNRHDANLVFQIIARRYEKGSIIITSNKAFSEWGQVFTDDVLATAILDRYLHHCDVITINGPSWRMKNQNPPTGTNQHMP